MQLTLKYQDASAEYVLNINENVVTVDRISNETRSVQFTTELIRLSWLISFIRSKSMMSLPLICCTILEANRSWEDIQRDLVKI